MDESEWLTCQDPTPMLEYLRGRASERKLRLFAVACCRHLAHLICDNRARDAIEVAERFADGLVGDTERSHARKAAQQAAQVRGVTARPEAPKWERRAASLAYYAAARRAMEAAWNAPQMAVEVLIWHAGGHNACDWQAIQTGEWGVLAQLLRDLFGDPRYRDTLAPAVLAWQGGIVVKLAETIYESRRWEDMPLLGDALEDAGCTDQAILNHCRGPGPHARGCHVVDLLLGKS